MAVNENLYDWMLKTQGMPAAEWYRSNPTKPHTSNPHVNPGEAKWFPQASIKTEDKTYASVSPEIVEESITVPAASSKSDYFQQYLNTLTPAEKKDIESLNLTSQEKEDIGYRNEAARQLGPLNKPSETQINDLITYNPDFGKYGGYFTKEDLGFSPSSALYTKYQDWADKKSYS
jgi:hypothetical protein